MRPPQLALGDSEIRALRPARPPVDPWRVLDVLEEVERGAAGQQERAVTLFLAGAECPFTCLFCDLWRSTLEIETPAGALPRQIARALEPRRGVATRAGVIKLYNASNFFDPRAVPDDDLEAIVEAIAGFERLTVESHPRLVGDRTEKLATAWTGSLEVAMGLETVHPEVLPRLNKRMCLDDFDRAAEWLLERGIAVRAFVLVGLPFVAPREQIDWTVRSVEHAAALGVGRVVLIPLRGGNGAMERLRRRGEWTPPDLDLIEDALESCLRDGGPIVTADTWDLERLALCPACARHRIARLGRINLSGAPEARRACGACGWPDSGGRWSSTR